MIDHTDAGDVPAPGEPGGGAEVLHYLHDALGSVVALTDAAGAVVERYTYDPYGPTYIEDPSTGDRRDASAYGNPFAWTGQRFDAGVNLYHFHFRSYSPRLGRWLQRDPLGYVDGVSLYQYVDSQPTFFTDPLGLSPGDGYGKKLERKIGEAITGVKEVGIGPAWDAGRGESYTKSVEYSNKYADKGSEADPGGAKNAARHANWQARLTYKHGENKAKKIGEIHELGNPKDEDTQADEHNNEVGREIGKKAKEEGRPIEDIDEMVDEAMEDGRLVRDRKGDPRIDHPEEDDDKKKDEGAGRSDSDCSPDDSSPESNGSDSPSDQPPS